jgi:magnesium transporter
MIAFDYEQVIELLEDKRLEELKNLFEDKHPADIAELINETPQEYHFTLFSLLEPEIASDVLSEIHDEFRQNILENTDSQRLVNIIDEMETDEAVDMLSELDDDVSQDVLAALDDEDRTNYTKLLTYSEESAGGLMQTEIIAVKKNFTRIQVIDYIRQNYEEVENIHLVYVVDDRNRLVGTLDVSRLLMAYDNTVIADIMDTSFIVADVEMDQENVANLFRKYDMYVLPVVDKKNRLLGRITVDDIIDVMDEEATEDAYKMAGLNEEDRVFTRPMNSVKKRLPWLVINLITAIIAASVVGVFQETIARLSILAVLMPIVAGMGGNAGTQTLTVITRGIALGELTIHNSFRAIIKELTVGFINGVALGSLVCLTAYLLRFDPRIGIILGIAMVCNMFIAGLFGSMIPVLLKTLRVDPALASGVIITTLTDISGFASFLGLATIFIK